MELPQRVIGIKVFEFVKNAMIECGADAAARSAMLDYVGQAMSALDDLNLSDTNREWFDFLGGLVTQRTS